MNRLSFLRFEVWEGLFMFFVAIPALVSAESAPRTFDLATESAFTPERGHGFDLGTAPRPVAGVADPGPATFYFSAAVPEGNWRVTVGFGGEIASDTTVKAESRRLMREGL